MRPPSKLAIAASLALLAGAPPLHGQTPPLPDSVQQLLAEFHTLQDRFENAQQRALGDDEDLRKQQEHVRDLLTETLLSMHPHLAESLRTLPHLQDAALAAERAGDRERFDAIVEEGRLIQTELEEAQAAAAEQPEVAREIDAFQARMLEGMKKVDPEIEDVLQQMQAIAARLAAWLG